MFYEATSKQEAYEVIVSGEHKMVQLDYPEGGRDVLELGRLGRKHIVAVCFIGHIVVDAKNLEALEEQLNKPKSTYQQRFISANFNISDEDIVRLQALASKFGDMVFRPEELHGATPALTWE